MLSGVAKKWWRDRFITLMLVPERTRRVHKVVIPFFLLKLGGILVSLAAVFLIIIGIDYIHVLGRIAENKRLKGENFKLRQELQLIRNKVDSMEMTIDRVRNYAKKLQLLTGQDGKDVVETPIGSAGASDFDEPAVERRPAAKKKGSRRSALTPPLPGPGTPVVPEMPTDADATTSQFQGHSSDPLDERVEKLARVSLLTETDLTMLQAYFLAQSAFLAATPSLLPIAGWISSTFGYRRNPWDGSFRLHAGVDIAADSGTPVRSPAVGHVIFSGYREGYGKALVIDHGYGIRTLFGHNSKLFVTQGQLVRRGEKIAEVGSTGHSTGPHLHYEVRKNGVPVNPVTFFARGRF